MCDSIGAFRFTWPGEEEKVICTEHMPSLMTVAAAMGFYLQFIPLTVDEILQGRTCNQKE